MFIRVDCDSPFNGKMARLRHACGMAGFGSLVTLWCWCGIYRQNGDLRGLRDEEIEQIALWQGTPGLLVITLKECGLLDGEKDKLRVHDWNHTQDFMSQLHKKKRDAARKRRARRPQDVQRTSNGHPTEKPRKIEIEMEKEIDIEKIQIKSTRAKTALAYSPEFLQFWAPYPKKVGKGEAYRQWQKARPPLADVLAALRWQVASERWLEDDGKYIPDPERYIKKRRWEDEPPAGPKIVRWEDEKYDTHGNLIA